MIKDRDINERLKLRKRAEEALNGQAFDTPSLSQEELKHFIHEMSVHQIELEMQNDELRRVQRDLEAERDNYSTLYIDPLKKAEEMVRKLSAVVEQSPSTIAVTDLLGNLEYVNRKFTELTGYTREEAMGKNPRILKSGEQPDAVYVELWKTISSGNAWRGEFHNKKKNGELFWEAASVSPVFDNQGKIINYIKVAEDISARKEAEEQIKRSLKEKEALLSEVHHRVKNNMQVIISLLRIQAGKIEDKKYADMFSETENRIRSMALIHEKIYQTADFANIEFGAYAKSLTKDLFRSYDISTGKVQLKIEIEPIAFGLDNAVPCGLILNELVSNALKHAFPKDRKGEIKISFRSINQDEVELTVSDDGIGIPEEVDIRKTESMGLQLLRILAENQLDGEVELDRDEGTSFRIRFEN